MRLQTLPLFALGALTTLAFAAGGVRTSVAEGRGVLSNESGSRADFTVRSLSQYAPDTDPESYGFFAFKQSDRKTGARFEVTMRASNLPGELKVDGKAAYLFGPAVLTRYEKRAKTVLRGTLTLLVEDNRLAHQKGKSDTLWMQFQPDDGLAFQYRGEVSKGDLRLWKSEVSQP